MRDILTQQELKKLVKYNRSTGQFTWRVKRSTVDIGDVAGRPDSSGHIQISINGRRYAAHRLAWLYMYGKWPRNELDHKDRNKVRNVPGNLREATHAQNMMNRSTPKNNTSGYQGVTWDKQRNKWRVQIRKNGRKINGGLFKNIKEAASKYVKLAQEIYGKFSPYRTNRYAQRK